MLGADALHPGCAYRWMRYASGRDRTGPGGALLRRRAGQRRRLRRCSGGPPAVRCTPTRRARSAASASRSATRRSRAAAAAGAASRSRAGSRPGVSCAGRDRLPARGERPAAARLRSMSPMRVVLLSLCTLLVGAGLGFGAAQLGGSDEHDARAPAVTTATARDGPRRRRRPRRLPDGRDVRVLPARLPRARRRAGPGRRPGRARRALEDGRLRPAHLPSPGARDRSPGVREVQEREAAEGFARETCWSGYHHGVMESYISQFDDGQLRARMNGICTQDASSPLLARLLQLLARPRSRAHDPLHAGRLPVAASSATA